MTNPKVSSTYRIHHYKRQNSLARSIPALPCAILKNATVENRNKVTKRVALATDHVPAQMILIWA